MSKLFPVPIAQSQLDQFKKQANELGIEIHAIKGGKVLRGNRALNLYSAACAYGSYNEVTIESTKIKLPSDTDNALRILTNERLPIMARNISNYSSTIAEIVAHQALVNLYNKIHDIQDIPYTDGNGDLPKPLNEFTPLRSGSKYFEGVLSKMRYEYINDTDYMLKPLPQESDTGNKPIIVNIKVDLSRVPRDVLDVFLELPQWTSFRNAVNTRDNNQDIRFTYLLPSYPPNEEEDWAIEASFDTWSEVDPTSNILTIWTNFKNWLLSFSSTNRIIISESINSNREVTPIVQSDINNTIEHQLSRLTKLGDITLFNLLVSKKEQYGHIFDSEVPDIDFKEVIDSNKNIYVHLDCLENANLWNDEEGIKNHVEGIGQWHSKAIIEVDLDRTTFAPLLNDTSLADLIHIIENRWPEGATCATQECDGEILFWSAPIDEVVRARNEAELEEGLMPLIGLGQQVHANYYEIDEQSYVAFDWKTSVVAKDQVSLN